MLGQIRPASGSDLEPAHPDDVIAASGQIRLALRVSGTRSRLELCSGDHCTTFACPGYRESGEIPLWMLEQAAAWPGQKNVALIQYVQTGSGSVPAFFKVTVSGKSARCQRLEPPEPGKYLPDDQDQLWGVYVLQADGHLDYRAGGFKKGRADACHACRPDTVLHCSWELTEAGFVPRGCDLSTPKE
jgi:hypothetical protein